MLKFLLTNLSADKIVDCFIACLHQHEHDETDDDKWVDGQLDEDLCLHTGYTVLEMQI